MVGRTSRCFGHPGWNQLSVESCHGDGEALVANVAGPLGTRLLMGIAQRQQ
ncbi:MAG: hypothetical protein VKM92_08530 [Cyanobacteriota bacterium]|nr:hypothetical protein [Cyanobacteriota bacterium]